MKAISSVAVLLAIVTVTAVPTSAHPGGPTHLIKFNANAMNGSSAHEFILSKHRSYVLANRPTKLEAAANDKVSAESMDQRLGLETIATDRESVTVSGVFTEADFVADLMRQKGIAYVEPNQEYKATYVVPPVHDKRSMMVASTADWGLTRIHQRAMGHAEHYEYDEHAGEGVHVFVLDTGVNAEHADFEGRAIMEANFITDEEDTDLGGHGTHVAAKIVGRVFGVAKGATVHAIKVLDKDGSGSTADLIKGLSHVISVATPGKTVINLSLSGPKSRIMDEIISTAVTEHNIPVFVSAGNSGNDACFFSPSSNPHVYAVGATDINDQVPQYSDFGKCVRIYAPGSNIKSAWIGSANAVKDMFGTSMANPHVVGIAASLLSKMPSASATELYDALTDMATKNTLTFSGTSGDESNHNYNLLAFNDIHRPMHP